MRIRIAIPDRHVTPQVLEAALEATALANESMIRTGEAPPVTDLIRHGVKWRPEPFLDGEHFDLLPVIAGRGWGDCDDLAPALAGELRATGQDPGAISRVYRSGPDKYHVVVQTSDGQVLDPSKWAGMRGHNGRTVSGTVARQQVRPGESCLCVVPHRGAWWSRCDVPWPGTQSHLASHAKARTPNEALDRAIAGAVFCGESIDADTSALKAIGHALLAPREEVGSLFGSLARLVEKAVPAAASFVPGGSAALQAASALDSLTHGGGHKGHAATAPGDMPVAQLDHPGFPDRPILIAYHPERAPGPVVMRF